MVVAEVDGSRGAARALAPRSRATHCGACGVPPGSPGHHAVGRSGQRPVSSRATSSAVCTMLSAAPLRRLSPQMNRSRVFGDSGAWRRRPGEARVGADDVVGRGELRLVGVVEHDDGRCLDERLAGLGDAHPPGERRVDGDRVRRHDGHPHAGRRDGQVGRSRILRVSSRTLTSSEVQPSPDVVADEGHDVERQRRREGGLPQLVLDEAPHVAGARAELAVAVHDVELVVEAGHAGAAQAGGGLEGRDDEAGAAPTRACSTASASIIVITVAPGLAMMPRGRSEILRGLTSGTTSGTSGSVRNTVLLSMATTPRAAASSTHSPGDRRRDVEDRDVEAVEELRRQRLDDDVLAADPEASSRRPRPPRPGARGTSALSRVGSTSSTTRPTAPVTPTTPSDGRASPVPAFPGGSHVSGRCPRRRRPHPRWSPARTPCAPPAPPRRAGRRG